jgi:hypothetical protein
MGSLPVPLMVSVQFGNLDTFCDELGACGPNVEPVVRICQQVRLAHSDTQAVLPMEHVLATSATCGATATCYRSRHCTCTWDSVGPTPMALLTRPKSRRGWISSTSGFGDSVRRSVTCWWTVAFIRNPGSRRRPRTNRATHEDDVHTKAARVAETSPRVSSARTSDLTWLVRLPPSSCQAPGRFEVPLEGPDAALALIKHLVEIELLLLLDSDVHQHLPHRPAVSITPTLAG